MFDQFTYKTKNWLLIGGVVLFAIIAYYFSISETIDLMQKSGANRTLLKNSKNAQFQINQLEAEHESIKANLGNSINYQNFQQLLLERVTNYCEEHALKLSNFPKPFTKQNESYFLQTFHFEVEGPFKSSLQLIYLLEEEWEFGKTISVQFDVKKNYRTKEKKLYTSLHLQSIKTN